MGNKSRTFLTTLVTVGLLAALLLLQACNRDDDQGAATPVSGGIVEATSSGQPSQPSGQPSAPAEGADGVAPADEAAVAPPAPVVYTVGQALTGLQKVTLFAATASSSPVLEEYGQGSSFTVLEPSDGFDAYPVSDGGVTWVRVRAADGLAGWARADGFGQ